MNTLSKSPVHVAQQALSVATEVLPLYAHRFSPKKYTQPQLFACLALKVFFRTDYRGITVYLNDLADLRRVLGMSEVPHFTTLHKACKRLLKQPHARELFAATVRRHLGRRRRADRVALDSTGLDCGHRSSYYVRRRHKALTGFQNITYKRFAKLELAVECDTHLIVGVLVGRGPRPDVDRFEPLLDDTLSHVAPRSVLADAGYDSEPNHRYARDEHQIRSFMPATLGRPTQKLPTGRYRRQMKQRLTKTYGQYGQRWQVETAISMIKRRLATCINGRSYWSERRDVMLLAITYNLMLVIQIIGFLQSISF